MQTSLFTTAIALYILCASLPSRRAGPISAVTVAAWLLHGAAMWLGVTATGALRIGFAAMLPRSAMLTNTCAAVMRSMIHPFYAINIDELSAFFIDSEIGRAHV